MMFLDKIKVRIDMKKIAFFMAFIVLLSSPIYALTIDAQPSTSCHLGQCSTIVDMTKCLAGPDLTTAKATDLNKNLPLTASKSLASGIKEIYYKWDKDSLMIYGNVTKNTYWTMDVNGCVIDPYWNYTLEGLTNATKLILAVAFNESSGTIAHDWSGLGNNITLHSDSGWVPGMYDYAFNVTSGGVQNTISDAHGLLNLTGQGTWTWWDKIGYTGGASWVYFLGGASCQNADQFGICYTCGNGTGKVSALWNATRFVASDTATATGGWTFHAVVYNGTHIIFYYNDSATTITEDGTPAMTSIGDDATGRWLGSCGTVAGTTFIGAIDEFQIWNISLSQTDIENVFSHTFLGGETSKYYETELYLNGNQTNASLYTNESLDIAGGLIGNLTGSWNLTLYANGTYLNDSDNNVTYHFDNLTAGIWPITLEFVGNATLPAFNRTLYAEISEPKEYFNGTTSININLNEAPMTCINDTYKQRNSTINGQLFQEIYACPNGCDAVTGQCSPTEYEANLYNIGIFGFIMLMIGLIYKLTRGRR